MIHGELKGVRFIIILARGTPTLPSSSAKANILIDQAGRARLADFGLLTITSDPRYLLSSISHTQCDSSDCYTLGVVIYETISGHFPFHKDTDSAVSEGKHPPRGARFAESLWEMLELRRASRPPNNRPNVEAILRCLELALYLSEPTSPRMDEGRDGVLVSAPSCIRLWTLAENQIRTS